MLKQLRIENIAVIESAEISLGPGLNVLTGETGAGKSIVIDSLQAVLGGRTSRQLVRTSADTASVTAVFESENGNNWLSENDFAVEDNIIIKRKISLDGKSSAGINGEPIAASQLRNLAISMLDIYGQNDSRQLADGKLHLKYLDDFGDLSDTLGKYSALYKEYLAKLSELKKISSNEEDKHIIAESLRFRIAEISAANLVPGEEDTLLSRREILRNSEKLSEAADSAYFLLYGSENSAHDSLGSALSSIRSVFNHSAELSELDAPLSECEQIIYDAAERIRDFKDRINFSDEEYNRLESRIAELKYLQKKYKVAGEKELLNLLENCKLRLDEIDFSEERINKLNESIIKLEKELITVAANLSEKRKETALFLKKKVQQSLSELNMPGVQFEAEITAKNEPKFDEHGADDVRFLISPNIGERLGPMSKIASGGELSRIMLALKETLSEKDDIETMVFDEVDEGVSGIAAQRVGEKLARLSSRRQLICVTHLPQIAALADNHYLITKEENNKRTYTKLIKLDTEGRVRELARLHGGENITETTLKSAREQLEAANKYKEELI